MIKKILFVFSFFISSFFVFQTQALAASCQTISGTGVSLPKYTPGATHTIKINMSNQTLTNTYYLRVENPVNASDEECEVDNIKINEGPKSGSGNGCDWEFSGDILTVTIHSQEALTGRTGTSITKLERTSHNIRLFKHEGTNFVCQVGNYTTEKELIDDQCLITVSQVRSGKECFAANNGCIEVNQDVKVKVSGLTLNDNPYNGSVWFKMGAGGSDVVLDRFEGVSNGEASITFKPQSFTRHDLQIVAEIPGGFNYEIPKCLGSFEVSERCNDDQCNINNLPITGPNASGPDSFSLCDQIGDSTPELAAQKIECFKCAGGNGGTKGVWTAIGCIQRNPEEIIQKFIKVGLGMGGGVALLSFLAAGFIYSTSQGSPDKLKNAQEMMTASIIGIIFIIFSVTILQFIGFSILQIPGFGG